MTRSEAYAAYTLTMKRYESAVKNAASFRGDVAADHLAKATAAMRAAYATYNKTASK